jgi:carbon storage regulator CsrA
MLILTRGTEEAVTVTTPRGEQVTVKILGFPTKGTVRLGFDAPNDFKILRDNAKLRMEREV